MVFSSSASAISLVKAPVQELEVLEVVRRRLSSKDGGVRWLLIYTPGVGYLLGIGLFMDFSEGPIGEFKDIGEMG